MKEGDMDLIKITNCDITGEDGKVLLPNLSFTMQDHTAFLVTGGNGSGKKQFIAALSSALTATPRKGGLFKNIFNNNTSTVSLEQAAALIKTERENDESDYLDGGVDHGRTARVYITQLMAKKAPLDGLPEIKLCGIESVLDRGIKYLSTGEVRRVMIAAAILSGARLLILSDIFSGLDVQTRAVLGDFFNTVAKRQVATDYHDNAFPTILLCADRYTEVPPSITHVLEFTHSQVSFCGPRCEYETLLQNRKASSGQDLSAQKDAIRKSVLEMAHEIDNAMGFNFTLPGDSLIEMAHVNVTWGDHEVLKDLSWTVKKGDHFLIVGPNGAGKTTLLELITGDNMQVFCNDVKLFGLRRGADLDIWKLKHLLGIVSYRLHVEYTMINSVTTLEVVVSGFRDTIGLYGPPTDLERILAEKWLSVAGLQSKANERFCDLSYGEQRAVLILRGAAKCPPLLILDEPCHALDDNYRSIVLHLLQVIAELGTSTLLHVTHEMDEVLPCCHHTLELLPNQTPMYKITS